jgi:hypothetical protein
VVIPASSCVTNAKIKRNLVKKKSRKSLSVVTRISTNAKMFRKIMNVQNNVKELLDVVIDAKEFVKLIVIKFIQVMRKKGIYLLVKKRLPKDFHVAIKKKSIVDYL